ncbi:hypothetical protein [Flavobacterium sp. W21_SRS_FM6]|uniref:hypothetical protein n=1 Tax=Flavobacterium sp. W21_SRS_FM6 TaxID=3240268 RepID=UPI003F9387AB
MQLNSQIQQIAYGRIRIAKEATDAFILTSSFRYQIDNKLLSTKPTLSELSNFELPLAYKNEFGMYRVFAGWIVLQPPYMSSKELDKKISVIVFDAKPPKIEAIAWEYVSFILSRTHHRNAVLSQIFQMLITCPPHILERLTGASLSKQPEPATMKLCSESRQAVRTQMKKGATAKKAEEMGEMLWI